MGRFWSYVTRGKYSVGCTGQSVYVYENGNEVLRLKGFQYTYRCCISPDQAYFALKSNTGMMYVYSLKDLTLQAKRRFTKADSTQDRMVTFSPSGEFLISVDTYSGVHGCVSYYEVPSLEQRQRVFAEDDRIEPIAVEPTDKDGMIYALLWERNQAGIVDRYSAARIKDGKLEKKIYITEDELNLYSGFIDLRSKGFTEKAKTWSALKYQGYDVSQIEMQDYSIEELFEKYAGEKLRQTE